jgi:glycerophosphoryl diester phosphodiesterase
MRLSLFAADPRVTDPLDAGPAGFAHRGLHHGSTFPENSLVAFAAALELGAGIECDLRLTADGEIVVFHDADAARLCASPIRIARSTLRELGRLQIGGQPIPTLASLLAMVDGRVPLLLEVKVDRDLWRWIPALRRDLANYSGRFGVMSFDPRIMRLLKTNMPDLRRGLILRATTPRLQVGLFLTLADPQFLALQLPALDQPWVRRERARRPVYAWTVRTPAERAQASVQADALIWEADGRP